MTYLGGMQADYDLLRVGPSSKTISLEQQTYHQPSSSSLFSVSSSTGFPTSTSPRRPGSRIRGSNLKRSSSYQQREPPCFNSTDDPPPTFAYPSPPSPGSHLDHRHLQAPPLQRARSQPYYQVPGLFGILDSPLVMRPDDYAHEKPLSPPLTSPLSTLSLPDSRTQSGDDCDCDFESESDGTEDCEIMCEDEEGGHAEEQLGVRKDTLSHEGEQTLGDMLHSEGARLSPLSPAWNSEMTLVSEDSALLSSSSVPTLTLAHRRSRGSLVTDRGQPYKRSRSEPYTTPSPTWTPPAKAVLLDHEGAAHAQDPSASRDPASYMPSPRLTPPRETAASSSFEADNIGGLTESLPTPFIPWGAGFSPDAPEIDDLWAPGPSTEGYHGFQHSFKPLLDVPSELYQPHMYDVNPFAPPQLDDEDFSMNVDHSAFAEPRALSPVSPTPTFPFQHHFDPIATHAEPLPPPCSPSISMLPDLSDDDIPFSPSRRSTALLPDLDMEDPPDLKTKVFSAPNTFSSPSPGSSLLSLPGVEGDDDLLPPPMPNFTTSPPPRHANCSPSSLLFIDDPQDVPLPRSPSPEDFDLRIPIDDDSDPELAKLCSLRKKSLAAERAARHAEAQLIEAGSVCLRAEATKQKRKNKERSKELGALLRIKLGDKIVPEESQPRSPSPGSISGISQLVARMLFKRHETFRPLPHRSKDGASDRDYVRSSLSRTAPGFSRADLA
ncbi:hypothetical protein HWV62_35496 [Athelia sp. TMB]|nr:hypothetical protein HWV62_35496 [Athelia sp. TMB]